MIEVIPRPSASLKLAQPGARVERVDDKPFIAVSQYVQEFRRVASRAVQFLRADAQCLESLAGRAGRLLQRVADIAVENLDRAGRAFGVAAGQLA